VNAETVLIRGGLICDGTGREPFPGTVTVRGDRIVGVGRGEPVDGADEFDATGMVVAPGIIDMHTHSDVSLLSDPDCVSAVGQGITSQIVGHCGFSAAPTSEESRRSLVTEEPVFGFPRPRGESSPWGWDGIGAYLQAVSTAVPRTNVGTLVGHNTVRRMLLGPSDVAVTDREIDRLRSAAIAGIDEGALGVSTGLSYAPGMFAGPSELAAFASAAGEAGKRYHTHMRYGDLTTRESLAEAIHTARASGTALNVSHLYPGHRDDPGEAERLLGLIDAATESGLDVTFDLTLFRRGGGAWLQELPTWAREGGLEATIDRIRHRDMRTRVLDAVRARANDWDDHLIVKVNRHESERLIGRTIGALARERGEEPAETALALVEEDGQFWVAPTIKRQEDLDLLLSHPSCVPVTDGMAAHPSDHASLGLMPKTFGTFPLLFGDYVRRRKILSLADAIARVTSLPARRLGLTSRGRIGEGFFADLVLFDPASVDNRATDDDPGRRPTGISHVMVNGKWALWKNELTPNRSGSVLT
jgi:N-acyl-D-aspartate/D-glutamate deacylase